MRPHGGPTHGYMRCFACEEFHVNSPWGLRIGFKICKNHPYVTMTKQWSQIALARWEALHFPPTGLVSITLSCMWKHIWIAWLKYFMLYLFSMHQSFLSPKYYPSDKEIHIIVSEPWLERLIMKFALMVIESNESRAELLEFVETMRHECENESLFEAWQFRGSNNEWYINWPHLMKVWQKYLPFPQVLQIVKGDFQNNIMLKAICERHWSCTVWMLWWEYHYVG